MYYSGSQPAPRFYYGEKMTYKKWCCNGCGKKVSRDLYGVRNKDIRYICSECKCSFTMAQLKSYAKGDTDWQKK